MNCQQCNSDRIVCISAKCSDLSFVSVDTKENDGYVPEDLGIGGGDYIDFNHCLECGQIQGTFPLPLCLLESIEES